MNPKRRIIPVFVPHMGCPNDCVFCNQRRIAGVTSPATPDTVGKAIGSFAEEDEPAELAFYGGSFTAIPESEQTALLDAAQPFLAKNSGNSIRISTRPDCVDAGVIARLRGYGVGTVELGAQSLDDAVLRKARRGHTAADVEYASEMVKGAGLTLILQMMTGLPGDTPEKAVETAHRFAALKPDGVRIYPTVIIRDTELFELWRRGEYREHTVEDAVTLCAELLELFETAKIPVIRLGLNPTDELTKNGAAAGAYHPAFGELCLARVYLNRAAAALDGFVKPDSSVTISVANGHLSRMIGQKRGNINELIRRFSLRSVRVVEKIGLEPGKISVEILC